MHVPIMGNKLDVFYSEGGAAVETVILGNSDLIVSRLGVGGCPFGGHGWGQVDRREMTAAIHEALDAGINFFDTADVYGLGRSEDLLGQALRGRQAVIATKCGVRVENGRTFYDNSPAWMEFACEQSLRRLGRDCIEVYQLHYRDGRPMGEIVETFRKLRAAGKIRYFGLSNVGERDLEELLPYRGEFLSIQNQYSLAHRGGEGEFIRLCGELAASPVTWGSLGQGVLTGKYGPDAAFGGDDRRSRDSYVNFRGDRFARNLQIVEALRPIAAEHGVTVGTAAVRFILDRLPGSVALCGIKRTDQLLIGALGWHLTAEEMAALDQVSCTAG